MGAAILGGLAACAVVPEATTPSSPPASAPSAPAATPTPTGPTLLRPRARWVAADWAELPGWAADAQRELWPALQRGCEKPAPGWEGVCAAARGYQPASDADARQWLQLRLRPWRVESLEGSAEGLATSGSK